MELAGTAAAWGWITAPALALGPGEEGSARLAFRLPRAPHPPAGPMPGRRPVRTVGPSGAARSPGPPRCSCSPTARAGPGGPMLAPAGPIGRVALALLDLAVAGVGLGALLGSGADRPDETATASSPDASGIVREGVRPSFDYTFLFATRQACPRPVPPRVRPPCRRSRRGGAEALRGHRHADLAAHRHRLVPPGRRRGARGRGDVRADPDVLVGDGGPRTPTPGRLCRAGSGPPSTGARFILHELVHVIDPGHVESRTTIMIEALTQPTDSSAEWGIVDRVGLRPLGRDDGCVNVPPVPFQGAPR